MPPLEDWFRLGLATKKVQPEADFLPKSLHATPDIMIDPREP